MLQPNRGQRRTLQPSVILNLEIFKAERLWRFAICQVHVKQYNVTLSLDPGLKYDSSDKGPNVAVLFPFPYPVQNYPHFYLKSESKEESFQADIIAVPYINGGNVTYITVYISSYTFYSPKIYENNYGIL